MAKEILNQSCMEKNIAIKVEHLFSVYNEYDDNQFVSLCDNNLSLEKNKIHFVIGNSGCGKSTLVNHFNGLLKTKYGNVLVEDDFVIGNNFLLQDYFIGVIDEKTIPNANQLNLKNNQVVCAVAKNLSRHLVKILFEAYYKTKVTKINSIKYQLSNITLYIVTYDNSIYDLSINTKLNFNEIKNYRTNLIKKGYFFKQKFLSRKKIKNIKKLKKTVGIVFQFPEYQLFKDTVINDVMFGPMNLGMSKEFAHKQAVHYLEELRINKSLYQNSPFNLSGGQKRRVALAGILSFDPKIIVFDEPTAGLDPSGEREIINIILNAKKNGKTIIVISHNMDHVLELADNVILMNDGEIICTGTPYDIFRNKELLHKLEISQPQIIDLIEKMIICDPKFKKIYDYQPRDIASLSQAITKVII